MSVASIRMYSNLPVLREATEAFWVYIRDELVASGMAGVPDKLDWTCHYDHPWLRDDLLLAQTCGYPYVRKLRGSVRLIATPEYTHRGCDGPDMRSFIVVRRDSSLHDIAELEGSRAAVNHPESNSGSNLFRAFVAPYAPDKAFFSAIVETGSHDASISAVSEGDADVAAIDCITFGNISRFDPASISGVRVIAETPQGPGLPFITRGGASDTEVSLLRGIFLAALSDRLVRNAIDVLSIGGFHFLEDEQYTRLEALECNARVSGYPTLR